MLNVKKMLTDLSDMFVPKAVTNFTWSQYCTPTGNGYTRIYRIGRLLVLNLDFTVSSSAPTTTDLLILTFPSDIYSYNWRTVFPLCRAWVQDENAIGIMSDNRVYFGGTAYTAGRRYVGSAIIILNA